MFTGLVEEMGTIENAGVSRGALALRVRAGKTLEDLKIDDSIAVSGVCLTVVSRTPGTFTVEAVEETLEKTNLGGLRAGDSVNLERAVRVGDRLGGHYVQGHVDGTTTVAGWREQEGGRMLELELPRAFSPFVIPKGSITVDGVSLTIAGLSESLVSIALIPHTLEVTTLGRLDVGARVNVELDLIGKYVARLLQGSPAAVGGSGNAGFVGA